MTRWLWFLPWLLWPWTPSVWAADAFPPARLFNRGAAPLRVGPPPAGQASLLAQECGVCHVAEAAEWAASLHRQAWTHPLFQEAYRNEPMPECRNCHQPLTAGREPRAGRTRDDRAALRAEGVNCAVCHVRDGQILATQASGRAPHPVRVAPALAQSDYCGGCHQFPFPDRRGDGQVRFTDEPMQDTLAEWQRTADPKERCQDCHMPWVRDDAGRRHRSHRFMGGYDPAALRRAIDIQPRMSTEGADLVLSLTLSARDVGHAVPTGDLYRALLIEAEAVDGAGRALAAVPRQERRLQRRFRTAVEPDESGVLRPRRRQVADDRLVPGKPQTLQFRFPQSPTAGVRLRLGLHRLPPGVTAVDRQRFLTLIDERLVRKGGPP